MTALLSHPGLDGASDAARLAAVVVLSRTSAASGEASITTRELGRWLGLSVSTVASSVLPELRRRGVLDTDKDEGEFGQDTGLTACVVPLRDARGRVGDALDLARLDLVLLLRLMEALAAPGWRRRDGRVTPAGLLGSRTGRGAARARLALLQLVLAARESGEVRLCGGAVDRHAGRPATTLSRMLGTCSPRAAAAVLAGLEDAGVVVVSRRRTGSGLRHRSRITVPAVAAAHAPEGGVVGVIAAVADPPVTAPPIRRQIDGASVQVSGPAAREIAAVADPPVTADLHTDHTLLVDVVGDGAGDRCFSGDRRQGCCRRPECACAREDAAGVDSPSDQRGSHAVAGGPLRGDKQDFPTHDQEQEQPETGDDHGADGDQEREERPAGGVATDGPETTGEAAEGASGDVWRAASGGRAPADIARIIDGVPGLWDALPGPGQQHVAATRIRAALTRIRGQLAHTEAQPADLAARILFDRMTRRSAESGGIPAARSILGWLTGRLLPQRRGCSVASCDDGYCVTTGDACPGCASRADDGRALRHQAWTETIGELRPGTEPTADQIAAYQRRLADLSAHQQLLAAERAERHAVVAAERAARQAVIDAERAVREAARQAQPCADCGAPQAAGLCGTCHEGRRATETLETAVRNLLAVSVLVHRDEYGSTTTPEGLDAYADAARQRLADEVDAATARHGSGLTGVALAASRRLTAQDIADRIRRDALRSVERLDVVAAEARRAGEAASRRRCGDLSPWDAAVRAGRAAAVDLLDRAVADLASDPACAPGPNTEPEEEAWTCSADDCGSAPVTAAGLCGRHLVARAGAARRTEQRATVAEDDLCEAGCGRSALRTGPYCGRCRTAHVQEIEEAAVAGGAR